MKRLELALGLIVIVAMTSSCGQKGALYLPPRGTVVTRPPTQTTPSPEQPAPSEQTSPAQPDQGQPPDKKDKDDKDTSQSPPE